MNFASVKGLEMPILPYCWHFLNPQLTLETYTYSPNFKMSYLSTLSVGAAFCYILSLIKFKNSE